jgi:hypothetical protein
MADGTQGSPDAWVLLDEWHVSVFVDPELPAGSANRLRSEVHAELSFCAHELVELLGDTWRLQVDVPQ